MIFSRVASNTYNLTVVYLQNISKYFRCLNMVLCFDRKPFFMTRRVHIQLERKKPVRKVFLNQELKQCQLPFENAMISTE